jgi:hypothetical protein
MPDRFFAHRAAIQSAVLSHSDAGLAAPLRAKIWAFAAGDAHALDTLDPALAAFVRKTLTSAYKIVDRDVAQLLDAGITQDAIYEAIVCVAASTGLRRIDAGLAALSAHEELSQA